LNPEKISIKNSGEYFEVLRKNAVIVNKEERMEIIKIILKQFPKKRSSVI